MSIHPDIKSLIDWGATRPLRCKGKYRDGRRRKRCLWRNRSVLDGFTYAVRHSSALHRFAICSECGQYMTEHYDYRGMLPKKSPIYRRYWFHEQWSAFADATYSEHNRINRGPIA